MEIKRGASFRVAFQFETDDEWTSLFPADYALSQIRFGDDVFDLEVVVDTLSQTIYLKGDTNLWPVGLGAFDIKIIVDDLIQTIPELTNIEVNVVEGITQ